MYVGVGMGVFVSVSYNQVSLDTLSSFFLWFKQNLIRRKYKHVNAIQNGTGSDSKQSAYI